MGFELTRFISEIDEEFQCPICTMVLEDPVQTPCEHTFCKECIQNWLPINGSCPVDRKKLTISDTKPPSRLFRNLWNKLEITCDFQDQGCSVIIKLENLKSHVDSCGKDLNLEIVCDKGCNMTISRREYKINNCFTHLVSVQEKENIKLRHELSGIHEQLRRKLSDQKEHFERIVNDQQVEIRKLNDKVKCQSKDNRKLYNQVSRQQSQLEHLQNAMSPKQQPNVVLSNKSKILSRPLRWQVCYNVKIEKSNKLKVIIPMQLGIVQSQYPLNPSEPTKCSFKVHVLGIDDKVSGYNSIGLIPKGITCAFFLTDEEISIYYTSSGLIVIKEKQSAPKWKLGDIIECGIKFLENFIDDGNHSATVYFLKNEEIIFEKSLTIPKGGLFPIIKINGKDSALQYFQ